MGGLAAWRAQVSGRCRFVSGRYRGWEDNRCCCIRDWRNIIRRLPILSLLSKDELITTDFLIGSLVTKRDKFSPAGIVHMRPKIGTVAAAVDVRERRPTQQQLHSHAMRYLLVN